jgi:phosphoglycerol transferase MdoB-like AlkP superfamily enzyme
MTTDQTERFFARILNIKELGNTKVVKIEDYRDGLYGLPKANFIKIYLENSGWFAVRPSGTEPKVKFYYNLNGKSSRNVVILEQGIKNDIDGLIEEDMTLKISGKTIFKFSIFLAILIAIMIILLFTVYNIKGNQGSLSIFVKI